MAIYDLNRSGLDHLLASDPVDPSIRQAIIDYLRDDDLLRGHHSMVAVQEGGLPLDPAAQVFLVDTPAVVATDANLKVIVDVGGGDLTVTGSDNVFITT